MIEIFPEMLTDEDFRYFDASTYEAIAGVLSDVTAMYIKEYTQRTDAIPEVVDAINKYLGESISVLTFPTELRKRGITDFVLKVSPEAIEAGEGDLDEVIDTLSYLQNNIALVTTHLPVRNKSNYTQFVSEIQKVMLRVHSMGKSMSYNNVLDRISSNKFLFYVPNEKAKSTGLSIISSRKRRWTLALEGARYIKECDRRGIPQAVRRNF